MPRELALSDQGDGVHDVELVGVTKRFGDVAAVRGVSLDVAHGEFLTLLGPSGCGKTTTLNMIAGFLRPDEGQILLGGRRVEHLPPYRRDTAMVFQQYALFPHMTIAENIGFGLQMRKVPKTEIAKRVDRALEIVRLPGLGSRRPAQLSGGQQQRVALARAIVTEPTVLLLDEPLSNLDLKLRESLRLEIKSIQRELGITAIYVTHDQGEALVMSDRIVVMNQGLIEQIGEPTAIYEEPRTAFVAEFIGTSNFLRGQLGQGLEAGDVTVPVTLRDGATIRARPPADGADRRRGPGDGPTGASGDRRWRRRGERATRGDQGGRVPRVVHPLHRRADFGRAGDGRRAKPAGARRGRRSGRS